MKRSPKLYYNFQRWTVYLQRQHDLLKSIYRGGHSNTSASKNAGHCLYVQLSYLPPTTHAPQHKEAQLPPTSPSPRVSLLYTPPAPLHGTWATFGSDVWLGLPPTAARGLGSLQQWFAAQALLRPRRMGRDPLQRRAQPGSSFQRRPRLDPSRRVRDPANTARSIRRLTLLIPGPLASLQNYWRGSVVYDG